ncbi:MAG: hypothetical protein K0Q67_2669 [Cellvibrio sp.]|nr:hypothetical protein [Cellvibrio sp.]
MNLMMGRISTILLLKISLCVGAANADIVYLRGSSTLAPIAQKAAEAYMAEHVNAQIIIGDGGTLRGYKSIEDGTANIAMVSSELCDVLPHDCKKDGFKKHLLGEAMIIVVVHKTNLVRNLTSDQLKDIFTGRITKWKDVGGDDRNIRVYLSPPNGGISVAFRKLILKTEDSYTPAGMVKDNGKLLKELVSDEDAISFLAFSTSGREQIKVLKIDDVFPSEHTRADKSYPLRTELMLVTSEKTTRETSEFIKYFEGFMKRYSLSDLAKMHSSGEVYE